MITTLVATFCQVAAGLPVTYCVQEVVTDSRFIALAGKVDAPIEMPGVDMTSCQINAQAALADWMEKHPIYRTWRLEGWRCVPGHYSIPGRA